MQVPVVVAEIAAPQAHYVLVQARRQIAGEIEYNVHDPWTAESTWIKASDIANDRRPGAYPKVGTHDELLAIRELTRDTDVQWNYDIELELLPFDREAP
jgi:hypothetical protein